LFEAVVSMGLSTIVFKNEYTEKGATQMKILQCLLLGFLLVFSPILLIVAGIYYTNQYPWLPLGIVSVVLWIWVSMALFLNEKGVNSK